MKTPIWLKLWIAVGLILIGYGLCAEIAHAATARASWYGGPHDTSSSNIAAPHAGKLDGKRPIIAHKTLAFGTIVRVKYKGRSLDCIVLDRGPYVRGRAFDLSYTAARKLKFTGVHTITYTIIGRAPRSTWRKWGAR